MTLPPGQRQLKGEMPRYGLPPYVQRWVEPAELTSLGIYGEMQFPLALKHHLLQTLPRTQIIRDFHCVTTWSSLQLCWEGWAFNDFWDIFLKDVATRDVTHLMATGADGFAVCLPLAELMSSDCLLADTLNGQALSQRHGAPLRLVVPQLYGYKSIKHLKTLELLCEARSSKAGRFLVHPRGRIDLEERSKVGPQRFWRQLYSFLLPTFLDQVKPFQYPPKSMEKENTHA